LINEIENQNLDAIEWIKEYKIELAFQSLPLMMGGMSMQLKEFLTTGERKTQIVQVIDKIIETIESSDDYITGSNLQKFRYRAMQILAESEKVKVRNQQEFDEMLNYSSWDNSVRLNEVKHRYQHAFILLRKLINGELNTDASSPEDYWIW
jgi:cytidylate kinase